MSLARIHRRAFFRRCFSRVGPRAPEDLSRTAKIASATTIRYKRLRTSAGVSVSKRLINGFIIHFRGFCLFISLCL